MNEPPTEVVLSPRQAQICAYLTRGATDKQISQALGISEATVDFHLRKLFSKFGVHNRSAVAVAFATRTHTPRERVAGDTFSNVAV